MSEEGFENEGVAVESSAPAAAPVSSTEAPVSETAGEPSKETMLDAVLQVVKPTTEDSDEDQSADKEEAQTSETTAENEDQAEPTEENSEETDKSTDEEEEKPSTEDSPSARKKINKLLKQRRELRDEVSSLKAPAEIGAQLSSFATSHDLSSDDIVNALHIAATLRRGDYTAFYEMVAPYVRHAQEYLGVVLPQDLQQMVEQQQMTETAAREFAKTRFDQQRTQIENQRMNELSQQYFTQQVQGNVARAVTDYESQLAASDPDWKAKAGFVHRAVGALLRERGGSINSVEEAVALVKQGYDEVNHQFKRFAQPKRATPPAPGGTTSHTTARAAPKNLMEAALAGLERSRAG